MKKDILRYALITMLAFLSISGLFGGLLLMIDPTGSLLGLPIWLLDHTILGSFLIPGIILFLFLGLLPGVTVYGLITRKKLKFTNKINLYPNRHWAWTFTLYSGIILVLWVEFQVMIIGYDSYTQIVYALLGVTIIILTLIPSIMKNYKIKKKACKCRKRKK